MPVTKGALLQGLASLVEPAQVVEDPLDDRPTAKLHETGRDLHRNADATAIHHLGLRLGGLHRAGVLPEDGLVARPFRLGVELPLEHLLDLVEGAADQLLGAEVGVQEPAGGGVAKEDRHVGLLHEPLVAVGGGPQLLGRRHPLARLVEDAGEDHAPIR